MVAENSSNNEDGDDSKWTARQCRDVAIFYMGQAAWAVAASCVDASAPSVASDATMPTFGPSSTALMLSWAASTYTAGKLLCGYPIDMLGAVQCWSLALLLCALCLATMALGSNGHAFMSAYAMAKTFAAACWPAMAVCMRRSIRPSQMGTAVGILSTASRLGTVVGGACAGMVLKYAGWRSAVALGVVSCGALGVALHTMLQRDPTPVKPALQQKSAPPKPKLPYGAALVRLLTRGRFWLHLIFIFLALPTFNFVSLLPTFCVQHVKLSVPEAAQVSAAFPLGMTLALPLVGRITDALRPAQTAAFFVVCFATSAFLMHALTFVGPSSWYNMPPSYPLAALLLGLGARMVPRLCCQPVLSPRCMGASTTLALCPA